MTSFLSTSNERSEAHLTSNDQTAVSVNRADEHRRSALLRAVGREPRAELRGAHLSVGRRTVDVASPYLVLAGRDLGTDVSRGLADALGLLIRNCHPATHRSIRPEAPLERVFFDLCEHMRCLALAPDLPGVQANLAAVSAAWDRHVRADGIDESGIGLLFYTATYMVRARLRLGATNEEIDTIIEGTRGRLAQLIGHELAALPTQIDNQLAFGESARHIARLIIEMAADSGLQIDADEAQRFQMVVPDEWFDEPVRTGLGAIAAGDPDQTGQPESIHGLGGYTVFTTAHDRIRTGSELYRPVQLAASRRKLDELIREQAVSVGRIAERLRRHFGMPADHDRRFGVEDGYIDGRRLSQLVASRDQHDIFWKPSPSRVIDTAVTVLMDNSGSMKAQRFETLAVVADTLARALDLAGVSVEVAGFSTIGWNGGNARRDWVAAGKPEEPGRLTDLAAFVYKDAATTYRRSRRSLAAMLRTNHFAESVDGESVVWAHQRLLSRPERRRLLLVISDGAPGESSTRQANRPGFLGDHLRLVVSHIERHSPVELAALTVDHDVGSVFRSAMQIDLDVAPTIGTYRVFEELFPSTRYRSTDG